jgi:hypothetical protein
VGIAPKNKIELRELLPVKGVEELAQEITFVDERAQRK